MKGKGVVNKGDHYEKVLTKNEKQFYEVIQGHNIAPSFTIEKRGDEDILKLKSCEMTLAYYMDLSEMDNMSLFENQINKLIDKIHSLNIVHIDLSPYNILLESSEDGFYEIKFIDFELSRFIDSLCEEDFDDFKTFLPGFKPRTDTLEHSIEDLLKYERQMWKLK